MKTKIGSRLSDIINNAKANPQKKEVPQVKSRRKTPLRPLVCAQGSGCFWVHDGNILQNLMDLNTALDTMQSEVFSHHVNKDKNDFANWVEFVLEDAQCATDLRKTKNLAQAKKATEKNLSRYNT